MSHTDTLKAWIQEGSNRNQVRFFKKIEEADHELLAEIGVIEGSLLHFVTSQTGGITFQKGWLRFLGAGSEEMTRSFTSWNQDRMDEAVMVADDAAGGFFALLDEEIFYLPPDQLTWENMELNYNEFLYWACAGDLDSFFQSARWNGWEHFIKDVSGDQGINMHPSLLEEEPAVLERSKRIVSIHDLWMLKMSKIEESFLEDEDEGEEEESEETEEFSDYDDWDKLNHLNDIKKDDPS